MKRYILGLFCLLSLSTFGQKAGVVVFGATPAGLAAAIQSAHSGVKTVLIDQNGMDQVVLTASDKAYRIGVYADFLKRVDSLQKGKNLSNENLLPAYTATVFKGWTDTIKNLSVIRKGLVKKIEKDGKNWEIELIDKREIKADLVIDATKSNTIAKLAKVNAAPIRTTTGIYPDKIYRTSVAISEAKGYYPAGVPVTSLFAQNADNFLIISESLNPNLLIGQGAGTAAAYCAFFKVTTKDLDIRKTQGELSTFNSQFLKFDDVRVTDSLAGSIQKIAITGILKGKLKNNQFLFLHDSTVTIDEIKQPIREYYSRSQIWFLDHKAERLTIADVLSLIKFTGSRGNELDKEVERGWNKTLRLTGKYDPKKLITRREFARLVDLYLKPFERKIDLEGNLKS
ncbi:FAD-dependent oxidoreductase [Desertivirga arenae]|uniref:FAD-dependent oxidoreductase n=1 Tax=Desertivirga arenae TaxID=2810309 RepID=UPI001A976C6D|nr:FAD-dependent oxidoreductase [Pedobacter sp. SYSU D00823]